MWCIGEPLKEGFPDLYHIAQVKDATVVDSIHFQGDSVHWGVNFTRLVQDWEFESVSSFLELLYLVNIKRYEKVKMCWRPSPNKGFQVKSYYNELSFVGVGCFAWKSIWKTKVPPRVAFFSWTTALGKILTADNLRRRGLGLVSWCCMCKADGESVDHLLLHCSFVKELWDMIFALFVLQWVMPRRVVDMFACWQGSLGHHKNIVIGKAIPHRVMWCIWGERNARTFEGCELSVVELKIQFYRSLLD